MKKTEFLFFAVLALALSAGFTSCEGKEDSDLIVGRWKIVSALEFDSSGKETENFTEDSAGMEYAFGEDGKTFTAYAGNETDTSTYTLSGKTLTIDDEIDEIYTITKLTKSELWIQSAPDKNGYYIVIKFEKVN